MLEHSGFAVERMPGLAAALDRFIAEAQRAFAPLAPGVLAGGTVEGVRATTLFQAIADCAGLTAAIFVSAEPEARILIALDERIDELIVASIFGESVSPDPADDPASRSAENAHRDRDGARRGVRAFSRARARSGVCAARPTVASLSSVCMSLSDGFALGRRDMPAAAARFSLPMSGGACEGLVLLPQSLLMPLRKELERDRAAETPAADRRWSKLLETGSRRRGCR